ncbi:MAG: YeiH family protein, partial [Litorivicinaceae bacterium]
MPLISTLRAYVPGIGLSLLLALSAVWSAPWLGGSAIVVALLIGCCIHPLSHRSPVLSIGIDFSASMVLRIAVALLGFRITVSDLGALGWPVTATVVCLVALLIGLGLVLARIMGQQWQLGVLTGGAVAICGASAAIALASVLSGTTQRERATLLTIIGVTGLSTVAMLLYPWLFAQLGWTQAQVGFALGASIHDVAQVVGAGYAVSPETGDLAVLTKMQRVVLLPVALAVVLMSVRRATQGVRLGLPWFVTAFALGVVINSVFPIPVA